MRSAKTTGEPGGPVTRRTPDSKGRNCMKVRFGPGVLLAMCALLSGACAHGPAGRSTSTSAPRQPDEVRVGLTDTGRTVELRIGQRLVVDLRPRADARKERGFLTTWAVKGYPARVVRPEGGGEEVP